MDTQEKKFYQQIGSKIKYYRQVYNLNKSNKEKITQEKLAELVDVCTSTIGNLESEKTVQGVSLYTLYKISKVLKISINKLIEDEE